MGKALAFETRESLVGDASVLIDFCAGAPTALPLIERHLGDLHVPSTILEEVDGLTEGDLQKLGLRLYEPKLAQLAAAAIPLSGLSFPDRVCLRVGADEGWAVVTNDKPLRKACCETGVKVYWGFELLCGLVDAGATSAEKAMEIAHAIAATNKYITQPVLDGLKRMLGL